MRFPCGFCAALLVVLALAVAVLCEKDGGSLVLAATVVPAQDKPRIGDAAQTKPAENGTSEGEPTATSRKDVVQAQQTASAENSSRTSVSNEETGSTPATSPNKAPSVVASERTALNSTSSNNSPTTNGVTIGTSTTLPQQPSTAAAMAQNADHNLPTAGSKSEDDPTPQPTVHNSSSDTTIAVTQSGIGVQTHKPEDIPSQDAEDAVVTGRSDSSTTQKMVASTAQSTISTAAPPSVRPETATMLIRADEVTSSLRASTTQHGPHSAVTAPPKLKEPPIQTKTTSSSVTPPQTAAAKQVTQSPSREVAKNTSASLPSGAAPAVAAMTNISEGEEVSITVIPELEEQDSKNESTSGDGKAATVRLKEIPIKTDDVERLASASTTTTVRSRIFSYVNYTDEDDAAEITHEKSSTEKSNETEKPTNLKTIDFHEYSTRETHQSVLSPLPAASQTLQPEVAPTLGEQENATLHSIPGFPVNLSGLNSSTSVVVSVSFSDDDNEALVPTKDNVSSPNPMPEPSQSSDLQNLVSNLNISSPKMGENSTSAKNSNGSGHISVFRPSSPQHRKYSPPTRKTTAAPSATTPGVVAAKNHHLGRAGLHLPTRKTTPGGPGSPTHKPHLGRSGTRAPFGNIGSTRRTTLGTKATIRPLTKIFDRARTRPHTKATTPRPNRGPRIRITTGKPTRKGFPIGPKPTLGNETNFDLDAYTRLLHVTRRPSRPPEPTWRTTFFNLTDPTPAPNEVEAPVIRVAGIAKIVDGWEWSPLLGEHNTHEFRYLAYTMRRMLASIFRRTPEGRYLYRVDIDGFSPGSVIVDYFVLFYQRGGPVDPIELASAFNSQLGINGSLGEEFYLDPTYTQFEVVGVVRPKPLASSSAEPPVPQWAIAVIVIATASLIFIVLFGAVTIYGRTAERRKYNSRLQDDDLENVTPSPSKDWESKLAASYENFAADSVYDTEDLHSPPPSHDPFQYDDRYKRKQHHMQLQLEYQQRQLKKEQEQQKQQKQLHQQHWWQHQKQHQQPAQEQEREQQQKQWYQQHWWQRHKQHNRREAHEQRKQHKQLQNQHQQQKQRHQQHWWQRLPSTLEKHWQQHQKEQKHEKQLKLQKKQQQQYNHEQQQQQRVQQQHIDSERDEQLRRELEEKAVIEASLNAQDTWRNKWGVLVNKLPLHARDTAF